LRTEVYLIDAFTSQGLRGNTAVVCLLEQHRDDAWLLGVTQEFKSETAFLERQIGTQGKQQDYRLRFFTVTGEDVFCGHGTLSTAHVLFEQGYALKDHPIAFQTASGRFIASKEQDRIRLDLPAQPVEEMSVSDTLCEAIGIEPVFAGKNQLDFFLEVSTEKALRQLKPHLELIEKLPCRGLIVTAKADLSHQYDFVSRFFAPGQGIPEDNATGSAHCALGPYWTPRLGKTRLVGCQASPRGALIEVVCDQAEANGRVTLVGSATTVMKGQLLQ
jgi:PhzF family phenazine biosynthesis protein